MLLAELCQQIDRFRDEFQAAVEVVASSPSVGLLMRAHPAMQQLIDEVLAIVNSEAFLRDCSPKIIVAFLGASSGGKTTLIRHLFPGVASRGWLISETTDTTSQALRIEYAEPESTQSELVHINFCSQEELVRLLDHPSVRRIQAEDGIFVEQNGKQIVVNGERCKSLVATQFPRKLQLSQISGPYQVTAAQACNEKFIKLLTTKVTSSEIDTAPLIEVGGKGLHALTLRAIVKNIHIRSDYARLIALAPEHEETLKQIVFIDTPGLSTAPSDKDEVLKHALSIKSNEIARQMCDTNEFDVIAHIVLVGGQSNFESLWRSLEAGRDSARDLSQRLLLIMTGFNQFWENGHLRSRHQNQETPDHFHIALRDNVLEKLGPTGCRPASIVFADSREYLMLQGKDYSQYYEQRKPDIENWAEPNGFAAETISELCRPGFDENMLAIYDENDCGGGYLVRSLAKLVEEKGPFLVLRRQVKRTGFLDACRKLDDLLHTNFQPDGSMVSCAAADVVRRCFDPLLNGNSALHPRKVEAFVSGIDSKVEQIVDAAATRCHPRQWLSKAFEAAVTTVSCQLASGVTEEDQPLLRTYFDESTPKWAKRWGISAARYEPENPDARVLTKNVLRVLAREVVYDSYRSLEDGKLAPQQDAEDREKLREAISKMVEIREALEQLCSANSVS